MHDLDRYELTASGCHATVLAQGAELCSFRGADGNEFIWQAGPAWPRHAPMLFPIVGRLADDQLRVDGATFPMKQHGFARDRRFTWVAREPTSCRLLLQDDAQSQSVFPFAFQLEVAYALSPNGLSVTYHIANPGSAPLLFSIGAHPAFAWPLRSGAAKNGHRLVFAETEPAPIRRLRGGLLLKETFPTPIRGCELALRPELFDADAIIMDQVGSRSVRYLDPQGKGLEISWHGFRELGLWSRAGADFLCIEPWAGYSSPEGFDGDFADKPAVMRLLPDEQRAFGWHVKMI